MSFEANEYGRSIAAPGLIVPDQPYTTLSRCVADNADFEGGFPLFAKKGEDIKVWTTKPADEDAFFLGVAQRVINRDEYPAGTPVTVVTTGMIWVKVGTDVKSGDNVAVTNTEKGDENDSVKNGRFVLIEPKEGITSINAKYITSASKGEYALVAIK